MRSSVMLHRRSYWSAMIASMPKTKFYRISSASERASSKAQRPTMAKRLLNRQTELLAYLTSSRAIFGDRRGPPLHRSLQDIDPRMLDLEARFSHQKRMDKIGA